MNHLFIKESESESHHSLTWMLSATVKKKENIKTKAQKFIKKIKSKNEDISNEPKIIRILDNGNYLIIKIYSRYSNT